MANLQYRTVSSIGKPSYTPSVEKEATTYTMCIVTEGDVEELSYIKGYFKTFLSNSNIIPQYVNDSLDSKEKHASHPKRRLNALKRFRASVHPNWKEYPDDITWLVCDRDAQSFKESQYDDVLVDCKKERIELIISNPSFQLWLLMHFVDAIDIDALNKNGISPKQIKYIEKEIRKHIAYQHGKLNFSVFKDNIDNAVSVSKTLPTDLNELKTLCGTNFAMLIEKLKQYAK